MASQEGCLDEAPTQQDATPSPMESILKELTELRKANQKLNDRSTPHTVRYNIKKLSHQLDMFNKADVPAQDKEKARASLNMDIRPRESS
ncbi:hypothetical protein P5673_029823 [Acropora cervicornis]|uniref:Uncharacterized protein n=1 Tax=Acropora cervicornis TaxID=6130 RepID=A0AAD9PV35_ACRCE|nr:hypothetical protein P5673_029823 [Acropora cervicornis]